MTILAESVEYEYVSVSVSAHKLTKDPRFGVFWNKVNRLARDGYECKGPPSMVVHGDDVIYTQLMERSSAVSV